MSLSTSNAGNAGQGKGHKIAEGVYVDIVPIKKVVDLSGKKLENFNRKFDLAVEVYFDQPDLKFESSVTLVGDFARTGGKITDWGGGFIIGQFFQSLGIESNLNEDYTIPKDWLKQAEGKIVAKVSYAAGPKDDDPSKAKYYTWNKVIGMADMSEEELISHVTDMWNSDREKGYPKNYDASPVMKRNPVGFPDTDSAASQGNDLDPTDATSGSAPVVDEDDDVPF